jgi:ADP-ribosyl-[dinitrogen reductase] hydrolase
MSPAADGAPGARRDEGYDAGVLDRAAGALLGTAAGDALGAGYEFSHPPAGTPIEMKGGGPFGWAPGEWTDDTQMAICIAEVTATGEVDLDAVGQRFLDWYAGGPADVGNQTRAVLGAAHGDPAALPAVAAAHFARNPHGSAGNGSLMRTAPVALACLGDDEALVETAMAVSALTHADPLAAEACALWCVAIDRAVREGRLDGIDDGLALLPASRRDDWAARVAAARTEPPGSFTPNGFVVPALQAALAAIAQTPVPADEPWRHLPHALEAAVRIGHDTDTVAAIAGGLLGARWGGSALPFAWRRILHGWPGYRAGDVVRLAVLTTRRGGSAIDEADPDPANVVALLDATPGAFER